MMSLAEERGGFGRHTSVTCVLNLAKERDGLGGHTSVDSEFSIGD